MAIRYGKLETLITVPTGGWDATVNVTGATIPAGTYYLSSPGGGANDFLQEVADRFATAAGTTCTVTASLGENGTGVVTITFGAARSVTWVDTDLRDVLGFDANLSSGTSHVSPRSARSVWLPDVAYKAPDAVGPNFKGITESNYRAVASASGYQYTMAGQYRHRLRVNWPAVKAAKVRLAQETTLNQSFERFWFDGILGTAGWAGSPGGPLRFYPDAGVDGTYVEYKVVEPGPVFDPQPLADGWAGGPHRIDMELLAVGS